MLQGRSFLVYFVYTRHTSGIADNKEDVMIFQKLRKSGNSYIVTIPKDEVVRQGFEEGQMLAIVVRPAEIRPVLSDELREAVEESWKRHEAGYRYLAGR